MAVLTLFHTIASSGGDGVFGYIIGMLMLAGGLTAALYYVKGFMRITQVLVEQGVFLPEF